MITIGRTYICRLIYRTEPQVTEKMSTANHHRFICPIIQQYYWADTHLRRHNFRRAGQQSPTSTLEAALKTNSCLKD